MGVLRYEVVQLEPQMCYECAEMRTRKERRMVSTARNAAGESTPSIVSRTEVLGECACTRAISEFERAQHQRTWQRAMALEIRSRSRIPERFADAACDNLRAWQKIDAMRAYVATLPDLRELPCDVDVPTLVREGERAAKNIAGVAFYGRVNVGKTYAAAAILNAAVERLIASCLIGVATLMEQIRTSYDRTVSEERKRDARSLFDRCHDVPLLVLDDLDKISATSNHDVSKLFELVDARYNAGLPIILTANMKPNELLKGPFAQFPTSGEAIVRRLVEMAPVWHEFKRLGQASDQGAANVASLRQGDRHAN